MEDGFSQSLVTPAYKLLAIPNLSCAKRFGKYKVTTTKMSIILFIKLEDLCELNELQSYYFFKCPIKLLLINCFLHHFRLNIFLILCLFFICHLGIFILIAQQIEQHDKQNNFIKPSYQSMNNFNNHVPEVTDVIISTNDDVITLHIGHN